MTDYEYIRGDLIKNPQKYERTKFGGIKFLKQYQTKRLKIKNDIKENDKFSLSNFLDNLQSSYDKKQKEFELNQLLKYLLCKFYENKFSNKDKIKLDSIVKKFEIKKKLSQKYDLDWKEKDEDYRNIQNYLLLALLCIKYYEKNISLRHLNCCLKLVDTIATQKVILKIEKQLFQYIIESEINQINNLMREKNIDI